ncbi:hypothetical protein DICPUDRAFT_80333 [Dictyostelium purpureum]|uniref:Uncharacterized protein n=1 Tax=Dictyostelium purpureum TaxID=5786 RepID=F0ZQ68_DICPU|nr:uncharacterized protein DICPUDRAFT_80333 [Dictyostelium purpureum]EGC33918.1 hypothetical protein DICPUDRAFT_80333 [Dictyostelium purpureum]|eukprot:XP_003289553.1 hypothetical protein DICPUDRAFT_80333 [Dictyostelium purpureum]
MLRRLITSNQQLLTQNERLIILKYFYTSPNQQPKITNNKNITKNNHHNNSNNENNDKKNKFKGDYKIPKVISPPAFLAERISSILSSIFNCLNKYQIQDCLSNIDKLKSIKVERYQPMYSVFQKMLEIISEEQNIKKRDKLLKETVQHIALHYSETDLIQVYCYNLVNEKHLIARQIENAMSEHIGLEKIDYITNDIIKNLLYFNRVDLALRVFRDRFQLYHVGNSMGIVKLFFDFHINRDELDQADVWDSRKTTLYHNDQKLRQFFADKTTNFNMGLLDDPKDYRHFFQKIHFFCNGKYCEKIPKDIPPNQLPAERRDNKTVQYQIELSNGIYNNDCEKIEEALLGYFFENNIIPWKNTLIKALAVLKKNGELNTKFPDYVNSILTYRDSQKDLELKFKLSDIDSLTHIPDFPVMNSILRALFNQSDVKLSIDFFKVLSNINGFHFTFKAFESLCVYFTTHFEELLNIYSPKEVEDMIDTITKHKKSHNLLIQSIEYDHLIIKHHIMKYHRVVSKIKHQGDQQKAHEYFYNLVKRVYNRMAKKNKTSLELYFEILKLNDANLDFEGLNSVYSDAVQNDLTREYSEVYIMKLIKNKRFDQIEENLNTDPMIIKDLSQMVLLEYFKLIQDNPKLIMKRFFEKASQTQHFIPELVNFVDEINKSSPSPNQMVSQLIQSIKENGLDHLVQPKKNDLSPNQIEVINKIIKTLEKGRYVTNLPI